MMANGTALVITSIASPNAVLRAFAEGCKANGHSFVVIGDRPSPSDFQLDGCDFWSLGRQAQMPFELAKLLPERHYARKNLGYLQAIRNGVSVILESDDDNIPGNAFWEPRQLEQQVDLVNGPGWVNVYRHFSTERVWPRGFPLECLQAEVPQPESMVPCSAPIQQGLADGDPDVDAIYRFTGKLPIEFQVRDRPVALANGAWCPFNSQNTTWLEPAFPLLYLPSFCSFRMTDIWRSYVAQRICWENGWNVLFHNATVRQERNEHDILKDFNDEVIGYSNNRAICAKLDALELAPGREHILPNMRKCYAEFIATGLIGTQELPLLEAWGKDLGLH